MKRHPLMAAIEFANGVLLNKYDPEQNRQIVEVARGYQQARNIFQMNMARITVLVSASEVSPGLVAHIKRALDSDQIVLKETDQLVRFIASVFEMPEYLVMAASAAPAEPTFHLLRREQITYGPTKRRKKGKDKRF